MTPFSRRHIGPSEAEKKAMLATIGIDSISALIDRTIPAQIRLNGELNIADAMTEQEYLEHIAELAGKNQVFKSFIGLGYHETIVPSVILRNVLENPGWYTAYTPYQAEISQGRLEALLNFQTLVCDLTGLEIAGARPHGALELLLRGEQLGAADVAQVEGQRVGGLAREIGRRRRHLPQQAVTGIGRLLWIRRLRNCRGLAVAVTPDHRRYLHSRHGFPLYSCLVAKQIGHCGLPSL